TSFRVVWSRPLHRPVKTMSAGPPAPAWNGCIRAIGRSRPNTFTSTWARRITVFPAPPLLARRTPPTASAATSSSTSSRPGGITDSDGPALPSRRASAHQSSGNSGWQFGVVTGTDHGGNNMTRMVFVTAALAFLAFGLQPAAADYYGAPWCAVVSTGDGDM